MKYVGHLTWCSLVRLYSSQKHYVHTYTHNLQPLKWFIKHTVVLKMAPMVKILIVYGPNPQMWNYTAVN